MIFSRTALMRVTVSALLSVAVAQPAAALERARTPPNQVDTETFFQNDRMNGLRVSTDGSYFSLLYRSAGGHVLAVVHRESQTLTKVTAVTNDEYLIHAWASDNSMIVGQWTANAGYSVSWPAFSYDPKQKRIYVRSESVSRAGVLIDRLPKKPNKVLFGDSSRVWEVDRRSLGSRTRNPWKNRVAEHRDHVRDWVSDANGEVRAAWTWREGEEIEEDLKGGIEEIWFRAPGVKGWTLVSTLKQEMGTTYRPLGFTADGSRLLVVSDRDRDRSALLEVNPETGETTQLVYEHPTAEIDSLVWGPSGELLGVGLYTVGQSKFHYFADAYKKHTDDLAAVLPGVATRIQSISNGETILAISAKAPEETKRLYVVDVEARTALDMGSVAPWLDNVTLAVPKRFTVRAEGGPEVEAFYTASESAGPRTPLIVMPHGGPIAVRDDVSFSPMAQLLAHRGYGVLQVNYRGSNGFGRAFQEAGESEWGKGIELDIDTALAHVLEQGWADPDRVAIFGWSYGGYSALMSTVLYPDRYRCAASMAGVTDMPLRFDAAAPKASPRFRKALVRIMGDPDTEFEDMKRRSPVYRAADIHVPVLLIQGARDTRVDVEHAYRMKLMLEKHDVPHSAIILKDAHHFFDSGPEQAEWFDKLLFFLETNLAPRETPTAD